jgi:hypothetical protein
MKTLLFAALLFATPALADAVDDYAACLIGQSAVAINNGAKDAEAAQEAAHEAEGLLDYVNLVVEDIAGQQ